MIDELRSYDGSRYATKAIQTKIWGFLKEWPCAEFGPAHIVLGDYNLKDAHIRWCLGLTRAAISHDAGDLYEGASDIAYMERVDWYKDEPIDELVATAEFLEKLLVIPEGAREDDLFD